MFVCVRVCVFVRDCVHVRVRAWTSVCECEYIFVHAKRSYIRHVFDTTSLYAWRVSFICVTWHLYKCKMTGFWAWHDSFIYLTCLFHIYDMNHSYGCVRLSLGSACVSECVCVCVWVSNMCVICHLLAHPRAFLDPADKFENVCGIPLTWHILEVLHYYKVFQSHDTSSKYFTNIRYFAHMRHPRSISLT